MRLSETNLALNTSGEHRKNDGTAQNKAILKPSDCPWGYSSVAEGLPASFLFHVALTFSSVVQGKLALPIQGKIKPAISKI